MNAAQQSLADMFSAKHDNQAPRAYNLALVLIAIALFSIGFVMVTSASMPIAVRLFDNPFHFAMRHGIYILIAVSCGMVVLNIPMQFWRVAVG